MSKNNASYKQIMKATSIFGGVQVFNILISIVRSKIIAILLGPEGMGIAGLLNSTTGLISALTNFGLGKSAVRNIAEANESDNKIRIRKVMTIFRRLVWITGVLGTIVTIVLASWLSEITFGNKDYTIAFFWLSSTLLFKQLTSGQNVILQGMRKLKYLAKANLIASFFGLIVSVPIYYYYGIDGIVPALIITSILSFVIAKFFANKTKIKNIEITKSEATVEGKNMLHMGVMLTLSSLMSIGAAFALRLFISNTGSVEDVGLYTAGFAIITTYVGLVFSAMGTDYYPRLSGVAHSNEKSALLINQQAEIGVLILAPILTIFLIFIYWIVLILYSSKFISVNGMLQWAALGMYFKVISWCIGYLLLAKGATKIFFWTELIANGLFLILNIVGYKSLGLEGLGISYLLAYIFSFLQVYIIIHHKYKFSFNRGFYKIFLFQFILGLSCFLVVKYVPVVWSYILGLTFISISVWYSYNELNKRLDFKTILKRNRNR